MAKNPELEIAFKALDEAIKEVIRVKEYAEAPSDGSPLMTSEWIIFVAQQGYDAEGRGLTAVARLTMNDEMAWHRMIGLVRSGQLFLENELVMGED